MVQKTTFVLKLSDNYNFFLHRLVIVKIIAEWVSEWLWFNARWAIIELYDCIQCDDDDEVRFVLDEHAWVGFL